ncbi:glutathione S-transferase family protein [Maricurvus nonylphenolicus]|uniref:glutathione S-transferase family protein n=1 Tax=Maricurvus nonylphenolicus TaxID=1008307 RepID=UPI0036F37AB9
MPIIETTRNDIKNLKGLHLFHFAASNCSQRVRMVLEEKGVHWTSHHINLQKYEHLSQEFQELNPKGVVPVLVHDGITITESNDIITYVDENFPGKSLQPTTEEGKEFLAEALSRSSKIQDSLKVSSFEFLFKPVRKMNTDQLNHYEASVKNQYLVDFMREFSSAEGFSQEKIRSSVSELVDIVSYLEDRLASSQWLSGTAFGLADISWVVNIYRLRKMAFPFSDYPHVARWLDAIAMRSSYKNAITKYESSKMKYFYSVYTTIRKLKGTSIASYI